MQLVFSGGEQMTVGTRSFILVRIHRNEGALCLPAPRTAMERKERGQFAGKDRWKTIKDTHPDSSV